MREEFKEWHHGAYCHAISLADRCRLAGGRLRTITLVSGLSRKEVSALYIKDGIARSGQFPSSGEWFFKANLFVQLEASFLISTFQRLAKLGISIGDALLTAYHHYQERYTETLIDFDRAFMLADMCCGKWTGAIPSFELYLCPHCGSYYLSSLGASGGGERHCPFCRLMARPKNEQRIKDYLLKTRSPTCSTQQITAVSAARRRAFLIGQLVDRYGARLRTLRNMTGLPTNEITRYFLKDTTLGRCGRHPSSMAWLLSANTFAKVEASYIMSVYQRLLSKGIANAEALITAYQQYRRNFAESLIDIDRAFDLASHLSGIWAESSPSLEMRSCGTCLAQYITPPHIRKNRQHACPFCEVTDRYRKEGRVRLRYNVASAPVEPALSVESNPQTGSFWVDA